MGPLYRRVFTLCFLIVGLVLYIRLDERKEVSKSPKQSEMSLIGRSHIGHTQQAEPQHIPVLNKAGNWRTSRNRMKNKIIPDIKLALKKGHISYISVKSYGRLGNNLFQYASLLGIAALNTKVPFVSKDLLHLKIFDISYKANIDTSTWPDVHESRYAAFDPQFENLPNGNVTISQYLQCWKYFEHIETRLRKEFQFKEEYLNRGRQLFKTHTSGVANRTMVAVHVRRSDMLSPKFMQNGYTIAPLSYIMKAVEHMRKRFGNPVFLIASDDIPWCIQHLTSPDMVVMKSDGDPYTDFVALTQCDHMIMTVGSYSWWAAWLINGHTVYYKEYPRKHSFLSRSFEKQDYFMPQWVPLGN